MWERTAHPAVARFGRNRAAVAGAVVLAGFVFMAAAGPALAPHSPIEQDLGNNYAPPSLRHPLGTDDLGRDTFSRLIHGARISLAVSVSSVAIGLLAGGALGLLAGHYRGWVDRALMRATDVLLAFPGILLAVVVVAILGKGLANTIVAVALMAAPTFARIARGSALAVGELEFVAASRALGASDVRIVLRHLLPNCFSPLLVQATLMLGTAILIASGLSFLGLGVQPPDPEWGAMLSKGRELIRTAPVSAVAPGVALTLLVLSVSLVGDGLRDALDPRLGPPRR
jgi:peptide/nickel transport system permease protein